MVMQSQQLGGRDLIIKNYTDNSNNSLKSNSIPIVLLAAGKGSRARELTGRIPKSIYPISGKKSILDHTIQQFTEIGFSNIIIVCGFKLNKVKKHLQQRHSELFKEKIIKIVDANPQWKNGPLYSFLSSKSFLPENWDHLLLMAADTIFSSDFLRFIDNLSKRLGYNQATLRSASIWDSPLLFFTDQSSKFHSSSVSLRLKKKVQLGENTLNDEKMKLNLFKVSQIDFTNGNKQGKKKKKRFHYLIPSIILSPDFFDFLKHKKYSQKNTVIEMLADYLKMNNDCFACKCHLKDQKQFIFHDFDSPKDYKYIKESTKGKPKKT